MARRNLKFAAIGLALLVVGGGAWAWHESQKVCCAFPDDPELTLPLAERPKLGLMTSLPLYWPLGADMAEIASGEAEVPWQRTALETRYDLVPLDTLSPIPGLSPEDPETDPLEGLEHLAVIQPRGLSPADNVALDDWVNGGGQLLLVLDPMLSGHYPMALGDPRRPVDTALIPPVVERWGLSIAFRDEHAHEVGSVPYGERIVLRSMAGEVLARDGADPDCDFHAERIIAQCRIGAGLVTLVADAASFEVSPDPAVAEQQARLPIVTLPQFAFP